MFQFLKNPQIGGGYKSNSKYFINVLNYGFLADTVRLSEKLPNFVKRFRYPISFWLKLLTAKQSVFDIDTKKYIFDSQAFNVSICNGQFFGGGWNISLNHTAFFSGKVHILFVC